jgi:hypothetical protein
MAISFSKKQNKQQYLIFILIIIALITVFVLRKDIFKISLDGAPSVEVFHSDSIEINFEVLKAKIIGELQMPEPKKPFEGKAGRDNPFISY